MLGKAELNGSGGLWGSCPLSYLGQKGLPEEGAAISCGPPKVQRLGSCKTRDGEGRIREEAQRGC